MSDSPAVLVTGAAGGIGAAIVQRFARAGWLVCCTDIDADGLDALVDDSIVARVRGDVRSAAGCRAIVDASMAATAGRLDALVNTAGVWREGPVEGCSEDDFDVVMDVNAKGTFFMCAAAIRGRRP